MSIAAEQIIERFKPLVTHYTGDIKLTADRPCAQESPCENGIVYVSDAEFFLKLLSSPAAIIVAHEKLLQDNKVDTPKDKVILASKNVYLAMARINQEFFPVPHLRRPFAGANIHPTAVIHPNSQVDPSAIIGPGAVVSEGVTIGARTYIGANTVIEPNVSIGDDCTIHPLVMIGHSVRIGHRCEIKSHSLIGSDGYGYAHDEKGNHYKLPHYGQLIIEDDVHIGGNVNIDRGTYTLAAIGAGTKIDNHCHFGHNVKIGKNTLITAGMIAAGSAEIGSNCIFGGRVTVNGHIRIEDNVTVAPLSGVANNIRKPGVYAGYPIIDFKKFLRVQASLASLPRIRRNLTKVLKHLGLQDEGD